MDPSRYIFENGDPTPSNSNTFKSRKLSSINIQHMGQISSSQSKRWQHIYQVQVGA